MRTSRCTPPRPRYALQVSYFPHPSRSGLNNDRHPSLAAYTVKSRSARIKNAVGTRLSPDCREGSHKFETYASFAFIAFNYIINIPARD
jgi:hypothetical protein